jgi:hypothetical protein
MSEAAESNETGPSEAEPLLGKLLVPWAISLLVGLLAGAGLSPALKGSRGGLDWWIDRVDLAAGISGQFAAMATWLLTIQLLLASFRAGGQRLLVAFLALLGVWPIVSLMGAQRTALPPDLWLGAVGAAAAGCLLTSSANRQARPWLALVLGFSGLSLLLELAFVTTGAWLERGPEVLPRLRTTLGLTAALVALVMQAAQSPRARLLLPAVVGLCGLLFLTALRASKPDAATWILMVGRTLQSMTPDAPWAVGAWAPSLQLCLALTTIGWAVIDRLSSSKDLPAAPLIAAACSLALAVPTTPLSVATMTLLGIASLPAQRVEGAIGSPAFKGRREPASRTE